LEERAATPTKEKPEKMDTPRTRVDGIIQLVMVSVTTKIVLETQPFRRLGEQPPFDWKLWSWIF